MARTYLAGATIIVALLATLAAALMASGHRTDWDPLMTYDSPNMKN